MKKLIVKDNALIEASYTLDAVEQRILLLAVLASRQQRQPKDNKVKIHAYEYMNTFGVERHASYEALRNGAKGLFEAKFQYQKVDDETGAVGVAESRWVESAIYFDKLATVELAFTSDVLPLIGELEKRFTQYEIEQIAGLQSRYSIRLYEMLMQWRSSGKTPEIALKTLRNRLGLLDDEYNRMCDFKSRVIDAALKQINEHTDIKATYEQHKQGRSITGFTFTFKEKPKPKAKGGEVNRDNKTGDLFSLENMTDKQIAVFSKKLAELPELGNLARPGDSVEQFAEMIATELRNSSLQGKYVEHLRKVGFKQGK